MQVTLTSSKQWLTPALYLVHLIQSGLSSNETLKWITSGHGSYRYFFSRAKKLENDHQH